MLNNAKFSKILEFWHAILFFGIISYLFEKRFNQSLKTYLGLVFGVFEQVPFSKLDAAPHSRISAFGRTHGRC